MPEEEVINVTNTGAVVGVAGELTPVIKEVVPVEVSPRGTKISSSWQVSAYLGDNCYDGGNSQSSGRLYGKEASTLIKVSARKKIRRNAISMNEGWISCVQRSV